MPEKMQEDRDNSLEGTAGEKAHRAQRDIATSRAAQKAITHGLRRFYADVGSEPVPDEFVNLLKQMDAESGDR